MRCDLDPSYVTFFLFLLWIEIFLPNVPSRFFCGSSSLLDQEFLSPKICCLALPFLVRLSYWLATSGGRVPVMAVCVLHGQLQICCVTDPAIL